MEYRAPGGDTQDIWIYDLDQETFSRLTFGGVRHRYPFWNPDGSEVGFSSDRDYGFSALYARPADLSGDTRLLFGDPDVTSTEGSWTPDGRRLVFRRGSITLNDNVDLVHAAPDSDSTAVVILDTPALELNPSLSPDGRWLVYTSNETGQPEVYVRPFPGPGGRSQVSTEGGTQPVWAHSGREILYISWTTPFPLVVATVRTEPDFAVESRKELFAWDVYLRSSGHPAWDLAPDDLRILAFGPAQGAEAAGRNVIVQNFFEELRQRMGN